MQPVAPPPGVSLGQPVGDYRLGRLIGQGRLGAVYEATHQQSGQRFAVRLLHPTLSRSPQVVARFPYEARTVSLVNHASVCEIREFGLLQDGSAFLVAEFLEGETLGARLRRSGRLDEGQALTIARQVARGLAVAHAADVAHGNLKPDNIVLVRDPWRNDAERAKIADLGLLRMATGGADIGELSREVGVPAYLAPEQRAGRVTDVQADVFALGVMLYEMIVGRPPFPGETIAEVEAAQARGAPASLRDTDPMIPDEMSKLVDSMLALAPAERPRMQRLAESLDQMDAYRVTRAHQAIVVGRDGPPSRPQAPGRGTMAWAQVVLQQRQAQKDKDKDSRSRRQAEGGRGASRRLLLGGMAVVMLAAIGGGALYLAQHEDPPPVKAAQKPPEKPPEPAQKPPEPAQKPPEAAPKPPEAAPAEQAPPEETGKKGKKKREKKEKKKREKKEKKSRHKRSR